MSVQATRGATHPRLPAPAWHLNLRPFAGLGLALLLFYPPFLRGLFFAPELLLTHQVAAGVFLLVAADRLLRREADRFDSLLDWLPFALTLAYALAAFGAVNLRGAAGEVLKHLNYALFFWAVSRYARTPGDMRQLLAVAFAGAVGVAAVGLGAATGYINFPGAWNGSYINSTLQYRNALAGYLAALQVVGLALWVEARHPFGRLLLSLANLPVALALLLSQSRGGWVVYPLAVALWLAGSRKETFWRGFYYFFLNLGLAMLTARFFLPRVLAGNGHGGLKVLLAALAVAGLLQVIIIAAERLVERLDPAPLTRRLITYGGTVYIAFVLGFYLLYAASALPRVGAQFAPVQLLNRAGSISFEDSSFVGRLTYYRDALQIIRNHPFTGAGGGAWNALYHRYQDAQYFSTEVHNQFLQTWVEAGTVGFLLFLAVWLALALSLFWLWRRRDDLPELWPWLWGAGVGALALAIHSFFDFDLSLSALALILWGLVGVARAGVRLARQETVGSPAPRPRRRPPARAVTAAPAVPAARLWRQAALALLLALALFVPSWRLYQAGLTGAAGARAITASQLPKARELMLRASRLDPFSASYRADLAQVEAALGLAEKDEGLLAQARAHARQATAREPFNPRIRATVSFAYLLLGQVDQAVAESRALLDINPLDVTAYEHQGRTLVAAARFYLSRGEPAMARPYVERAARLPEQVEARARNSAQERWTGPPLRVTPLLALSSGQASYLLGELDQAARRLEEAAQDERLLGEAALWRAAVAGRAGRRGEAEEWLARAAAGNPAARQAYQEILSLRLD